MDTKIHPEKRSLFQHGRRHARIYVCHYFITIKLVLNMVKAVKKPAKAVKINNTSQSYIRHRHQRRHPSATS